MVCPGLNDGDVLDDTLAGVLDRYPALATVACVPLGVSRFSNEPRMRPHTQAEAAAVCDAVDQWQEIFLAASGRRMVFAADEYYLMAGRPFPGRATYEGFPQHENGIGMARAFEAAFGGDERRRPRGAARLLRRGRRRAGRRATGPRGRIRPPRPSTADGAPIAILTGEYGARVLGAAGRLARAAPTSGWCRWPTDFFGGNIGVAGPADRRRPRPGAGRPSRSGTATCCPTPASPRAASSTTSPLADLPRPVEVVPTDGLSLRRALDGRLAAGRPSRGGSDQPGARASGGRSGASR